MDKLKAALVYKFWMLLAVALLVPLIGWWMATSAISAQVGDRITKIKTAFDGLKADGENPNEKWTTQIKRQVGVQESSVQQAHQLLFEGQKRLLTWPAGLSWQSEAIPSEGQITQKDIDYYRNLYDDLIQTVYQIPSPIDPAAGTGLVNFPFDKLPHEDFSSFPPSRLQIIETREDMWLFSTLLTAIANVNQREDAKTQLEAPIRQISKIELRGGMSRGPGGLGGGGAAAGQGGVPAAGGGGGAAGAGAMPMTMGAAGGHSDGARGGMAGSGGGSGGGQTSVEFDAAEDFGSDSGGGAGGAGPMASAMPPGGGGAAPAGGHSGPGGGGGSSGKRRYLEENSKYKTRGFYMSLTMDHRKLPDLLVELSNSAWPIRVMRVQQADLHMQDLAAAVGAGAGAPVFPGAAGGAGMGLGGPFGRAPGGAAAMPGEGGGAGSAGSLSALDDPFLVQVAFCGFFTIYKPPVTPQSAGAIPGGASPGTPTAPSADGAASPPLAAGATVAPDAATAATVTPAAPGAVEKPTTASPTESPDDAAKPNPAPADEAKKDGTPPPAEVPENSPSKPKPGDAKPSEKADEKAENPPEKQ